MAEPKVANYGPTGPIGPSEPDIDITPTSFDLNVGGATESFDGPPEGQISVLNPNGEEGYVPINWLLTEGIKKGYKLPSNSSDVPTDIDVTPDKQIKVIRKSDGSAGSVPLDWYLNDPNSKNYIPESKADVERIKKHNTDIEDYSKVLKDPLKYKLDADFNVVERDKNAGLLSF